MGEFIELGKKEKVKLFLDPFIWQITPQGKELRYLGITKNINMPEKWINNLEKNCWIYEFIYKDGKRFNINCDYYDYCSKK
jgi:hypothetical protein